MGGGLFGQVKSVIKKFFLLRCNITGCTHKILAGGGLFGQVKSVIKIFFLLRCNVTGCTHKILARGGLFGQVKSVIKNIFLLRCNVTVCTHKILHSWANLESYKSGVAFWFAPMKFGGEGGPPILHTKTRRTD